MQNNIGRARAGENNMSTALRENDALLTSSKLWINKVSHNPSAAETLCCTSFPSFNTGMRNMASVNDTFEVRVII